MRFHQLRTSVALFSLVLGTACSVPNHMHVTEGVAPQNVDLNVRFRTTYYFRVFDFCWQADLPVEGGVSYRDIIPATDTIYRYRMTGKASALGSQIKFESGTINADQIDPFGSDVVYDRDAGGYIHRTQEEAKQEAKDARSARDASAARTAALERYQHLAELYAAVAAREVVAPVAPATSSPEEVAQKAEMATIATAMGNALSAYIGTTIAPLNSADHDTLVAMAKSLEAIETDVAKLANPPAPAPGPPPAPQEIATDAATKAAKAVLGDVTEQVKTLLAAPGEGKALSSLCPAGAIVRKGFQIMGPEGMQSFDQSKRLIMAMHTSAKPLIDTLQEYSGRVIRARVNPSEQLLPLVREYMRVVETDRTVDQLAYKASGDAKPTIDEVFDGALATFQPAAEEKAQ